MFEDCWLVGSEYLCRGRGLAVYIWSKGIFQSWLYSTVTSGSFNFHQNNLNFFLTSRKLFMIIKKIKSLKSKKWKEYIGRINSQEWNCIPWDIIYLQHLMRVANCFCLPSHTIFLPTFISIIYYWLLVGLNISSYIFRSLACFPPPGITCLHHLPVLYWVVLSFLSELFFFQILVTSPLLYVQNYYLSVDHLSLIESLDIGKPLILLNQNSKSY